MNVLGTFLKVVSTISFRLFVNIFDYYILNMIFKPIDREDALSKKTQKNTNEAKKEKEWKHRKHEDDDNWIITKISSSICHYVQEEGMLPSSKFFLHMVLISFLLRI